MQLLFNFKIPVLPFEIAFPQKKLLFLLIYTIANNNFKYYYCSTKYMTSIIPEIHENYYYNTTHIKTK
jgi:hypothetical protein